jgi:hypothetical protein
MKKYIGLITVPITIVLLPLIASAQLVMNNNYYMVMNGGTPTNPTSIVLTNPAPAGITNNGTGWIVSENEFNQVDWNIGTNAGNYVVPFGYGTTDYLPVTCNITTAGAGAGTIRFATYHGSTWDNFNYRPSDVTTMSDFQVPDFSNNAVDRFWILDAKNYTTNPTPNITFSYIRNGGSSEIAAPNYIVEADLIAQRFDTTIDHWNDWFGATSLDITAGNTGTVTSGAIPPADFFRSWTLFTDSALISGVGVQQLNVPSSTVITFPNPTSGSFTVSGLTQGQVVELYDYLGQRLTSTLVDNATMHFDITAKANGVYFMRIENNDGSLETEKKIVKAQ